ncbi:murein DD-endopeptidase MepM/ murein hydrolase activator NlpD [Leifsonia sp. AK011]|uniref:M23 family metallopeptidase n=1 Tax=Leifsonia sp. AK011 TaxID=2723075 RepID=UPI0015CA66D6|nr:M23 family metallopeptidase [Leifsonia sp. AK011]NYF09542.1 murein DD-endopeptidase MepM/ murein hydrolase activator NlpD [Leifsonia sp. AK011]
MNSTRAQTRTAGATRARLRLFAFLAVTALLATSDLATRPASSAFAVDYPTWDDVAAARNNEAAAANQIAAIEALIGQLTTESERAQADATAKGARWGELDSRYQAAAGKAQTLLDQAEAAKVAAADSGQRAGQMAAQLARAGGSDITATLLAGNEDPDSLLYGLGMSGRIAEQTNALYERAVLDRNTARALTDQADVARDELEQLKIAAEAAFVEAQAASEKAAAAVVAQQENQARLAQQLVVLKERRAATEADYQKGVEERAKAGIGLPAGAISAAGWAKPVAGRVTSSFGPRVPPTGGASSYHQGTDFGAGCGSPIYAAAAGTVVYAGWNGGYGNFVLIDHGGGVATAYAHIVGGGTFVGYGQQVAPGTHIANVGTTGTSTGCHLHLEVRIGGTARDAVPFFAERGITLG